MDKILSMTNEYVLWIIATWLDSGHLAFGSVYLSMPPYPHIHTA